MGKPIYIINNIAKKYFSVHFKDVERVMLHPHDCQKQCFDSLISKAKHTEWGKKYDYHSINRHDTYKERLPINDYESLYPYIERMIMGEKDILWKGKIKWYSKSSGTSGSRSKYIPVSWDSLHGCNFKGGKDTFAMYLNNRPDSKLYTGKYLSLSGSWRNFDMNANAYCGDISAILSNSIPRWGNYFRTPSKEIALMSDWNEKVEAYAQYTRKQNVTAIAGVPSWILVIIRRILELEQTQDLSSIWTNLELFMHGGVNFTPYKSQYKALIPNENLYYQQVYNASEGYFAAQDLSDSDDMLLLLNNGVFYEFIPLHEFGKEHPKVLNLEEVKAGMNYVLVISTNAGLWRYVIGDVIQFTSVNPYRIIVSGRTTHFINAFGEELMVDNAEKALKEACLATDAIISEYTAAPVYLESDTKAAHEWLIEFKQEPSDLELFTTILDAELMKCNSDYEAKRSDDILLQKPIVQSIPQGTFVAWLASREKLGGQYKVTRLSNNRDVIEEIKRLMYKVD
jgi:GH3 auxin-responsive promoter.